MFAATKQASECGKSNAKKWDLALYAPNDADGFTKVCLSMPWRMHQR
jgi:hypothetical protein